MGTWSDFSRGPVRNDSAPDHSGYDDSEHCGSESLHPALTASAARVRFVPYSMIFAHVLTTHYRIQDSALVMHVADGSRSSDLQRHQSVPYDGSFPGRDAARDIFHLSPIHRGATNVEHEWYPLVVNPDPVRTQGPVQRDSSHVHFTFASSWNNGIYNPSAADSSLLDVGGFTPPINTGSPSGPQGVYAHDSFTLYPNPVSREAIFPQDGGPLMQPPCPPYYAARLVPTAEHAMSDQSQSSGSGTQGPPLIVGQNYVRCEMLVPWRYSTFDFLRIHLHSIQHLEAVYPIVIPLSLQTYGRLWSLRGHMQGREVARNIGRLFSR